LGRKEEKTVHRVNAERPDVEGGGEGTVCIIQDEGDILTKNLLFCGNRNGEIVGDINKSAI